MLPSSMNPRSAATKRESELQARVDELTEALGEAYVAAAWHKGGLLPPFEVLVRS